MRSTSATTRLSVVVPVHDVEEYLPAFLRSLEGPGEASPTEIVFVDDGSTDAGADLIATWIASGPHPARLIRTENRGVSAARNTGLDAVEGDWVCFLDPDDVLGAGYFGHVLAFLATHPDADLVATALWRIQEPDTRFRDNHPLRFRFAGGTRIAELGDDVFVMNAASVCFPAEALRRSGARFQTGLHASEDALFVAEYLLRLDRAPRAGFVAEAHYGYRKRAARTSAVDRYRVDPSSYTRRFREGYEPLLRSAAEAGGVPSWLQSMVLYEMQWLLPVQWDPTKHASLLTAQGKADTLNALSGCLRFIENERLLRYDASALPLESRLFILALIGRPLWNWVGAYASMPRGWRRMIEVVGYTAGDSRAGDGGEGRSWHPDYFGQRVLCATRMRVPDAADVVDMHKHRLRVIRPLPGETLAQAQDRHRRKAAGDDCLFIPALEQEVSVRRTRPWADGPVERAAIRREQRRRGVWSKDAMVGRLFRPGRAWLIEHDPDDPDDLARELFEAARGLVRTRMANARGSSASSSALRFGSLRHRIARARARVIISTRPAERPSPRSRIRGFRLLVLRGPVDDASLLQVRRFAPDAVVCTDAADREALHGIGMFPFNTVAVADPRPQAVFEAALRLVPPARSHLGRERQHR